jgi:DNA primase
MEINELKSSVSIIEVADRLGIQVNKQGKAHCPFHDDKTPSLQFSKEKNIATCFSSRCSAGTMDIIGLTEKYMKVNTHEAIMQLKEWAGAVASRENGNNNGKVVAASEMERIAILTKAFRYYENGIKTSPRGKAYLDSRGMNQATPNRPGIEVGFNSGNFLARAGEHLKASALKYGLAYSGRGGSCHPFAKDSLVFPLKNRDKKIVGLYFRSLDEKATTRHYYLKDRQGLYPGYPKPETTRLILTESIIDTASLMLVPEITKGYQILACYGTNGFTEEHTQAIKSLENLMEITLFFDGDTAGTEGVKKNARLLKSIKPNIKISFIETPGGEDINSLSISHEPEIFAHLLESRKEIEASFFSTEKKNSTDLSAGPKDQSQQITRSTNHQINTQNPNKITYFTDTAHYYVKGGLRQELDRMQVSLMIESKNNSSNYGRYRNRLDLYENKQVERMAREAAEKLSLRADLIELDLYRLTDLLEDHRDQQTGHPSDKPRVLPSATEAGQCKDFLSKPNLIPRFNDLIGKAGVVGEENKIIQYQNKKASGKIDSREEKKITEFIQNCIRMLKPYEVINPYADKVQLPEEAHKIRRLNDLYQSFVKQITLMNQYRRKKVKRSEILTEAPGNKREVLITEKEDLQVAAEIMFDSIVLKIDELDGSLRLFYEQLKDYIKGKGNAYESYSFGQREIRQALNISKSQLQRYIHDLLSLEYIYMTGGHINKGYRYKVAYWDDVAKLKGKVQRHLQGQLDQLELNVNQATPATH